MKTKTPSPTMLHLFVYILPEHIWKDIDGKAVRSYTNEPGPDGDRRLRAVHHHRAQDGPVHPARGEPELLAGRAGDRRAGVPDLPERGLARAGAAPRRDRLRRRPRLERLREPRRRRRGDDLPGSLLGLRRDRVQRRARRWTTGRRSATATRRSKDQRVRVALSHAIDTKALVERVLGGHGTPGTSVIPPIYEDLHFDPGDARVRVRPRGGQAAPRRGRLHRGRRTASAPCREAAAS